MIDLSEQTEALARRLAAAQRLSVDETVRQALVAQARDIPSSADGRDISSDAIAERKTRIRRISKEIAALPILDPRSPHEIMDDLDPL